MANVKKLNVNNIDYDIVDAFAGKQLSLIGSQLSLNDAAGNSLSTINLPIVSIEEINFSNDAEDFYLPAGTSLPEGGKGKLYIINPGGGGSITHPYTFRNNANYTLFYGNTAVDYISTDKKYLAYMIKDTATHYNVYFLSYPCYETTLRGTNTVSNAAALVRYISSLGIVKYESSDNTTSFFKMYGTDYDAEDEPYEYEVPITQTTYFYVDGHYITVATNVNDFMDVPVNKIVLNTDHDNLFNRIISAEIAVECSGVGQVPHRLFTTDGTTYPIPSPGMQSATYIVIIGRYYKL